MGLSHIAPDGTRRGDRIPNPSGNDRRIWRNFCQSCKRAIAVFAKQKYAEGLRCQECRVVQASSRNCRSDRPTTRQLDWLRAWGVETHPQATRAACSRIIEYVKRGNGDGQTRNSSERVAWFKTTRAHWEGKRVCDPRHNAVGEVEYVLPRTRQEMNHLQELWDKDAENFSPFLAHVVWEKKWKPGERRYASVISFKYLQLVPDHERGETAHEALSSDAG